MAEPSRERVGVYIDFDNIVISRYSQLHGRTRGRKTACANTTRRTRMPTRRSPPAQGGDDRPRRDPRVRILVRLDRDQPGLRRLVRGGERGLPAQLIDRAVDLVQLFPTVRSMKNGADIRLAVDVVEDVFRLDDLTQS